MGNTNNNNTLSVRDKMKMRKIQLQNKLEKEITNDITNTKRYILQPDGVLKYKYKLGYYKFIQKWTSHNFNYDCNEESKLVNKLAIENGLFTNYDSNFDYNNAFTDKKNLIVDYKSQKNI